MYTQEDVSEAQRFWNWFYENHFAYEFLEEMEEAQRKDTLHELAEALVDLTPTIDAIVRRVKGTGDHSFEIIITANNNPDHFHWAKFLVGLFPEIPGWSVRYLCPPYANKEKVLEGLNFWSIAAEDIRCFMTVPYEGFGFTNINIVVEGREFVNLKMNLYLHITELMRLMVSDLIGEEACGLHLKHIIFSPPPTDPHAQNFYPILELPQRFPQFKQDMADYAGF